MKIIIVYGLVAGSFYAIAIFNIYNYLCNILGGM